MTIDLYGIGPMPYLAVLI